MKTPSCRRSGLLGWPDSLGSLIGMPARIKSSLRKKALSGIDLYHPPNFGAAGLGPRAVAPLPPWGTKWGNARTGRDLMPDSLGFVDRDAGGNKICLREKALGGIDFHHPPNFGTAVFGPRSVAPLPDVGRYVGQPALRCAPRDGSSNRGRSSRPQHHPQIPPLARQAIEPGKPLTSCVAPGPHRPTPKIPTSSRS